MTLVELEKIFYSMHNGMRVDFAVKAALNIYADPSYTSWAQRWLDGDDTSTEEAQEAGSMASAEETLDLHQETLARREVWRDSAESTADSYAEAAWRDSAESTADSYAEAAWRASAAAQAADAAYLYANDEEASPSAWAAILKVRNIKESAVDDALPIT